MKKFAAVFLLMAIIFGLCGCSSSDSETSGSSGFSSMNKLVKAYVDMQTCAISKEQYRKCFAPNWDEEDIEEQYSVLEQGKAHWQQVIKKYGDNFEVSYNILSKELVFDGSKDDYTAVENQEHIQAYGLEITERKVYSVVLSLTLKGSEGEDTSQCSLRCVKVGDKWYGDDRITD